MIEPRIGVDARPLCHPGTGIYRYTLELLQRLCRAGGQWFLYSPQAYDTELLALPNVTHRVAALPAALPPWVRAGQLAHLLLPRWVRRDRLSAFWGPRHQLPLALPREVRAVVTIHDLVWRDCGDTMRFPGREIERFFTPRALARADAIAAVSQFTRSRLVHYFAQYAGKVAVVPGASMLPAASAPVDKNAAGGHLLFVGTMEPRKNLPRLLAAYKRLVATHPAAPGLKIVGARGWGDFDVERALRVHALGHRVELLGSVDDEYLQVLYRGAYALLMPSLYEGFGLPVVEALSAGVPVVTSRDSAMVEIAGNAGLYVDPESEQDIFEALVRIIVDKTEYRRLQGQTLDAARQYDWDVSASLLAELLLS